jgi:hypothetical protein
VKLETALDSLEQDNSHVRCKVPEPCSTTVDITKSVYLHSFMKDVWDEVKRERADANAGLSEVVWISIWSLSSSMNVTMNERMQVAGSSVSPCLSPDQRQSASGVVVGNMTARSMVICTTLINMFCALL